MQYPICFAAIPGHDEMGIMARSSSRCPSALVWTAVSTSLQQRCCLCPPAMARSTFFDEDAPIKLTEVETLKTEFGTGTMGINPKTHNLFLTTADFCPTPAAATKGNPLGGTEAHSWNVSRAHLRALEKSWSSRGLGSLCRHRSKELKNRSSPR